MIALFESMIDFFIFVPFFPNYKIRRRMNKFMPRSCSSCGK